MKGILALLFLGFVGVAPGQDGITFTNKLVTFTNLQRQVFRDVRLVRADADGIMYRETVGVGGGLVCYTNLPVAFLESLGIFRNQIAVAKERAGRQAAADAAYRLSVQQHAQEEMASRALVEKLATLETGVGGEVLEVTPDGALIAGSWHLPHGIMGEPGSYQEMQLLSDYQMKLIDGNEVSLKAYYMGLYTYVDVKGGTRTVRHYTCDAAKAVAYLNGHPPQGRTRAGQYEKQNAGTIAGKRVEQAKVVIGGRVLQRIGDSLLVDSKMDLSNWTKPLTPGEETALADLKARLKVQKLPPGFTGLCLLTEYSAVESIADNDEVDATIVYPTGTYQYTAVNRATKTVRRFTADKNAAIRADESQRLGQ